MLADIQRHDDINANHWSIVVRSQFAAADSADRGRNSTGFFGLCRWLRIPAALREKHLSKFGETWAVQTGIGQVAADVHHRCPQTLNVGHFRRHTKLLLQAPDRSGSDAGYSLPLAAPAPRECRSLCDHAHLIIHDPEAICQGCYLARSTTSLPDTSPTWIGWLRYGRNYDLLRCRTSTTATVDTATTAVSANHR